MQRIVLLAVVAFAALASPADAWDETVGYDVPGGGVADCLRTVGPGRMALLGALGAGASTIDLLDVGATSIAPVGSVTPGWLTECSDFAVADGVSPLLATTVLTRDHARLGTALRIATPGADPVTLDRPAGLDIGSVSAATVTGGAAVLAWLEAPAGTPGPPRLLAAVRPSEHAPFGAPVVLDAAASSEAKPAVGIDATGRATVAWLGDPAHGGSNEVFKVASARPGAGFQAPQELTPTLGHSIALAVTPQGRALIVAESLHSQRAFERLPDAPSFTRVHLPFPGSADELTIALNPDGGSVIAYRNGGRSVFAMVRVPGGTFRSAKAVVADPGDDGDLAGGFVVALPSPIGRRPQPPYDASGGDLTAALSPAGAVLLTWVDDARDGDAASAHVARGTLGRGFATPARLGSPCRSAAAARPLTLPGGELAVAWSDDADADTAASATSPQRGGRVHVAREADADHGAQAHPLHPAPELRAQLLGSRPLGTAEPLRVRVRCRTRCDVRATAIARSVPQPRWVLAGARGAAPLAIGSSTALSAGSSAVLTLRPFEGYNAAGLPGQPRSPVTVTACTPGGPVAERVDLHAPQIRPPRPVPRTAGLVARRQGGAIRVTWRTTIPARDARFTVYGLPDGDGDPAQARRAGHGRTRFAVTLRPTAGQRVRQVLLVEETPELWWAAQMRTPVRQPSSAND